MVQNLRGERTVMLSSHVLAEVERVCSRVAIIKDGRIVAGGTFEELEANAGRRGEVEIVAPGQGDALAAWLTEHGHAPHREDRGDVCIVHLDRDDDGPPLLAAMISAGLAVGSFRPLSRSLQDIFLDLTRSPAA